MEPKKNPKYDVHRKRGIIFNMSLVVSLIVVIAAFKWVVPVQDKWVLPKGKMLTDEIIFIPITDYTTPSETPKPKIEPRLLISPTEFVEAKDEPSEESDAPHLEQREYSAPLVFAHVEIPIEVNTDSIFIRVEKMPEPVNGYQKFYKSLNQNINYPPRARRLSTEGKVYVQFTVNEDGGLTDFKVIKGIGDGCDEEAIRVISLTKWSAGKQRGVPVKVRMVQPIAFALNR